MIMANPYLGAAIAQGISSAVEYNREQPYRKARLQEAQARAKLAQQQVDTYEQQGSLRQAQQQNEVARLKSDTYNTNSQLAKTQTFDAFKQYNTDKDTRHLNNWLQEAKNNPVAKNVTQGMIRIDPIVRNQTTEAALRNQGVKDIDGFFSDDDMKSTMVLGTRADGSQQVIDLNKMYAVTGYTNYANDEARKSIQNNAVILARLRQGANLTDIKQDDAVVGQVANLLGTSRGEAMRLLREKPEGTKTGSSQIERVASQLRQTNPDLSYRDSLIQAGDLTRAPAKTTDQEQFISDYMDTNQGATREQALTAYREAGRDERTSDIKNTEYAEEAKTSLDKDFGGDFLDADLTDLSNKQRATMAQYVNRIEQVGGLELSNEDKKNARNITKLLSLGGKAGSRITAAETGPIDSILRQVKSYVSDNVQGKEGTQAYEAFRAIARNALFGSQVSNADYSAFNKAFASLGQQTGPVLASLKTQMEMIRDDLEATASLNDPYVAKARLGVNLDKVDDIVNAINDRLSIISGYESGNPDPRLIVPKEKTSNTIQVKVNKPDEVPPAGDKPSLDEIFGAQ